MEKLIQAHLGFRWVPLVDDQGPAGEEWVEGVDGDDPDDAPGGRPLASGLSLACQDSVVSGNVSRIDPRITSGFPNAMLLLTTFLGVRPLWISPTLPWSSMVHPVRLSKTTTSTLVIKTPWRGSCYPITPPGMETIPTLECYETRSKRTRAH